MFQAPKELRKRRVPLRFLYNKRHKDYSVNKSSCLLIASQHEFAFGYLANYCDILVNSIAPNHPRPTSPDSPVLWSVINYKYLYREERT